MALGPKLLYVGVNRASRTLQILHRSVAGRNLNVGEGEFSPVIQIHHQARLASDMHLEELMATTADAEIILKLYDLRREPEMRRARDYIGGEFWPESFEGLWKEIGMTGDKNRWFRQVYGYWEMAAALAVYGGVDEELFVATQIEMFYVFAKISPYVKNFREKSPDFMISITTLCERNAKAQERLSQYETQMPLFRQRIAEEKAKG